MLEIKGQYSEALVFNDEVEATAISQIYSFVNCKAFEGSKIRIMPDVHAGAGSVIGFTSTFTDKVVPNVVGVDICCGVASVNLGKLSDISFEKLDVFIRNNIPSGCTVRQKAVKEVDKLDLAVLAKIVEQTGQKLDYVLQSVGTLGGGNHFMELDLDDNGDYWFTVHTGSRNFGLKIANYFQTIAKKETKHSPGTMNGLEYIQGEAMADYIAASQMAYNFAQLSRKVILSTVAEGFFGERFNRLDTVETLHNYIDIKNSLIRKGAVAAYKGDRLIIPWNMRDGIIIGTGKGNEDWNCSAPHGAGRVMGRREAKEKLKVADFKDTMQGIWSSCVCPETIDESPMAYKEPEQIKKYIGDTMTIDLTMRPVYNYKAND
jgi:tRNA-splicing ligase RtcB (3'-phosphate/5'-hydroxy nucleic acid ligase)